MNIIVWQYYIYKGTAWGGFHIPIVILLFQSRGLTFSQIGFIMSVTTALILLMEVPSGFVADRFGRKWTMIAASLLFIAGSIGMGVSRSVLEFVVSQAFISTAIAFRSGSSDAWLYDYLQEVLDEEEFSRVRGRGSSAMLAVMSVTSLAGGYIGEFSYGYAYFATAGLVTLSIIPLLNFPRSQGNDGTDEESLSITDAIGVTIKKISEPKIKVFILYTGIITAIISTISALFIQPVSIKAGLSVRQLGWMYAGFTLLGSVATYFTGDIKERIGIRGWFLIAPAIVALLFIGSGIVTAIAIPTFFLMKAVQRISTPLSIQYINDNCQSINRATLLSAVSIIYSLIAVPLKFASGIGANAIDPLTVILVFGIILVFASFFFKMMENMGESPIRVGNQ